MQQVQIGKTGVQACGERQVRDRGVRRVQEHVHKAAEQQHAEELRRVIIGKRPQTQRCQKRPDAAAIASGEAAKIYEMEVLVDDIQNNKDNYTRFIVIGHNVHEMTGDDKSSFVLKLKHVPGSLVMALETFVGTNMLTIEKRPIIGRPFEYVFFMDFEGHISEERINKPLSTILGRGIEIKFLGSYPKSQDFERVIKFG